VRSTKARRVLAVVAASVALAAAGAIIAPADAVHHVAGRTQLLGNLSIHPKGGSNGGGAAAIGDTFQFGIRATMDGCVGLGCDPDLEPAYVNAHGEFFAGTHRGKDPCLLSLAHGPLKIVWADGSRSGGGLTYVFARPVGALPGTVTAVGSIKWGPLAGSLVEFELVGVFDQPCRTGTYPVRGIAAFEHIG
jgi:hypothetical protein